MPPSRPLYGASFNLPPLEILLLLPPFLLRCPVLRPENLPAFTQGLDAERCKGRALGLLRGRGGNRWRGKIKRAEERETGDEFNRRFAHKNTYRLHRPQITRINATTSNPFISPVNSFPQNHLRFPLYTLLQPPHPLPPLQKTYRENCLPTAPTLCHLPK